MALKLLHSIVILTLEGTHPSLSLLSYAKVKEKLYHYRLGQALRAAGV
jgi:hypothetical protein